VAGPEASIALHWDAGVALPLAFCGSKAGATFRLAMVSIVSGVKPRASQRRRNNCRRSKWKMGPGRFSGRTATPPTLVCPGAGGDGERSHGLKFNHYVHVLYIIAGMI
jgi:hypothetical protein